MKKFITTSMIIAATFTIMGTASAASIGLINTPPGWQYDAFNATDN